MKVRSILAIVLLSFFVTSCVQKKIKRVVVYTVDVSKVKNIKNVGLRGWDDPLSWREDYPMQEIVKDSLYQVTIVSETGRICNEFKFSINNEIELDGNENRKIYFDTKKDTTEVSFVFGIK